ncbi:MAG: hypothetical protein IPP34_19690 [Bacteroidetes bacterium]|nr:hypothetical protein [Bacteroidota bacterium]
MKARSIFICFILLSSIGLKFSNGQTISKIILDKTDTHSGYYLVIEPEKRDSIKGVLVLLAGFGQTPEHTVPETKLHLVAYSKNILTVLCAGGNKLYADSITQQKLSIILKDVISRFGVKPTDFVLGGFSAGGMIAMRYTELCKEFPDKFPIQPKGIFTVDSPIDIFTIYEQLEETARNKYSEIAVEEAVRAIAFIKNDFGVPRENIETYAKLTPFSMNKAYSQNEIFLKDIAVRTYHDVDIAWRIINRNQTVHLSNYEMSAELINRLVLMGNKRAEFMQSFKTGYRSNGQRHPHSWSIVDEKELIFWMEGLLK